MGDLSKQIYFSTERPGITESERMDNASLFGIQRITVAA